MLSELTRKARTEADRLYLQAARLCVRASWVAAVSNPGETVRTNWQFVRECRHAAELIEAACLHLQMRADAMRAAVPA